MTVVLPHVVQLETKMLVHFPGNTRVHSIADPRVKMSVVKDFVSDKAGDFPNFKGVFELHAIAVMNEIKRWLAPMVFKPMAIAEGHVSQREFERGLDRQAFFLATDGHRRLVLEMCVERKNGQVFSQPERNPETSRRMFCYRSLRLSTQVQISEQDQVDSLINRSCELLLTPKLRGRLRRTYCLPANSISTARNHKDAHH